MCQIPALRENRNRVDSWSLPAGGRSHCSSRCLPVDEKGLQGGKRRSTGRQPAQQLEQNLTGERIHSE